MFFRILADIVVLIHFLWIVFLAIGALWGRGNKAVRVFHMAGLAFAFVIQVFDWYCPLTHLEIWLRSRHDPALAYTGSFIIHYIERIVYIELPRHLILALTIFLCGFNGWIYLSRWRQCLGQK